MDACAVACQPAILLAQNGHGENTLWRARRTARHSWRRLSSWDMIPAARGQNVAAQHRDALPDRHARRCGACGSVEPVRRRSSATARNPVRRSAAGGSFLIFDAGSGSGLKADLGNLPLGNLDAVFFTHLHSGPYRPCRSSNHSWRYGRSTLTVIGPAGNVDSRRRFQPRARTGCLLSLAKRSAGVVSATRLSRTAPSGRRWPSAR